MLKMKQLAEFIAKGNWQAAEKFLKAEARKKSATADVFYNLAKVLEAGLKYQQSGYWLRKAVGKNPDYQIAWFELGRWSLSFAPIHDAYEAFYKAYALDPEDDDARRNFGRIALRLGQWGEAEKAWSGFDDIEAKQAKYRIVAETGHDATGLLQELLRDKSVRPQVIKTMTKTAIGAIPLKL